MKFTNIYGLPGPMVDALSIAWPPSPNVISVSALIGPPRIRTLQMKYWDELKEDVSSRLWSLLGQGLHTILEKYGQQMKSVLVEYPLKFAVGEITISGRPDFYSNGVIEDYKVTSVYSFLLGEKPEWEKQLNVYAYLFRRAGFPVDALRIRAILRDWMEGKTLSEPDYPPVPFMTVEVPLWPDAQISSYVEERIRQHFEQPLAPCTDEERWARPNTWAVAKIGARRALRVFESEEDAIIYKKDQEKQGNSKLEIRKRPGEYVRCARFCPVRSVCDINLNNNKREVNNNE